MKSEELILRGQLLAAKIGWPGLLGIVLVLFWAGTVALWLPEQEVQRAVLRQNSQALRAEITQLLASTNEQRTPEARYQALLERFPEQKQLPRILARLQEIARANEMALDTGEYPPETSSQKTFPTVVIVFPTKTDYLRLRKFLAEIRRELPTLAIEDIQLKRDTIAASTIEARLRLRLYMKPGT